MNGVTTGTTILRVDDLTIRYHTNGVGVDAVRGLSFEMADGEALALIGESGSGKSTVAHALMGLLPGNAEIVSGSIRFGDIAGGSAVDLVGLGNREFNQVRWTSIALVPQGAINALNPVMRVAEHFEDTSRAHGYLRGHALRSRAEELLVAVQLAPVDVWQAYPHELSGGMRQRVVIALAMLMAPRILVLDEPTTALDVLTQRAILDVLFDLRRQMRFGLIFISHDLPVAAELADRVLTMYAGRLVEVLSSTLRADHDLHPYTAALWRAVPSLSGEHRGLRAVAGAPPDLESLPTGCAFHPRCELAVDLCRTVEPRLRRIGNGHLAACHRMDATRSELTEPTTHA